MLRRLCESKPESHKKNVDVDIDTLACDTFWTKSCKGLKILLNTFQMRMLKIFCLEKTDYSVRTILTLFVREKNVVLRLDLKCTVKPSFLKQGADYYSWLSLEMEVRHYDIS